MDKLKQFYQSFGFIVAFILMCVIVSATMGEKFLSKFLLLVFTSQIILNADIVTNAIKSFEQTNIKLNTETEDKTDKNDLSKYKDDIYYTIGKVIIN